MGIRIKGVKCIKAIPWILVFIRMIQANNKNSHRATRTETDGQNSLINRIKPPALQVVPALLCGQVGDVMGLNLQKAFSLTHSLAVVRGTGNTERKTKFPVFETTKN